MKKIILLAAISLLVAGIGYCVDQPQNIGYARTDNPVGLASYTLTQMNALTPLTTGYAIHVQDAVQSKICVSSGAGTGFTGAWVIATASGTFVGNTYPHCN